MLTKFLTSRERILVKAFAALGIFFILLMLVGFLILGIAGFQRAVASLKSLASPFLTLFISELDDGSKVAEKIKTGEKENQAEIKSDEKPPAESLPLTTLKPAPQPPAARVVETPGEEKTFIYERGPETIELKNGLDLAVKIIDRGVINESAKELTATTSVKRGERAGVIFEISNLGNVKSGAWRFRAELPTSNGPFESENQTALAPAERIRFTIGFGELISAGENSVTFKVFIKEGPEDIFSGNNLASTTLNRAY